MNKLTGTTLFVLFSLSSLSAQIDSYRHVWLFAPDASNASFIRQKSILTDEAGLNERDIKLHEIIGVKGNETQFARYKAGKNSFTFILVGKDGSEKMRSTQPVSSEKLYRTIDAMPMRKAEMSAKKP